MKRLLQLLKINGRDAIVFTMSLLLAFSIWLMHNLSQNYTEIVDVYVRAKSNVSGHSQLSVTPVPLTARCRTRGFDIIRLNKSDAGHPEVIEFAPSDLHDMGRGAYYITGSDLNKYIQPILGNNASNTTILNDTLVFNFAYEVNKKVPVRTICNVTYKSQYINIGDLKVEPDSVYIYGDPLHLEKIDCVVTEPFSMTELSADASGRIGIEPIRGIRMSADEIEYHLQVERYVEITAEMPVKAVNVPLRRNLVIYPSVAKVRFCCAFPLRVNPQDEIKFYIDFKDFENSLNGRCLARASDIPEGVFGYVMEPQVFDCVESVK